MMEQCNGYTIKILENVRVNCPFNYQTVKYSCIACSNPNMIKCDDPSSTTYLCDWGEDNKTSDCKKYDLNKLVDKAFDSYGNVVNQPCNNKNSNQLCQVYLSSSSKQYLVLDSCQPNQFVQKVVIGSVQMSVCKDFATCLEQIPSQVDGVTQPICSKCSPYFYNMFGSCIDACPSFTYQNKNSMTCETPIQYCSTYVANTSKPQCSACLGGYVLNKSTPSDTCIPYSSCTNGYYFDVTFNKYYCSQCPANCDECLQNLKCIKPSAGLKVIVRFVILLVPNVINLQLNACFAQIQQ
ncbi:hypothetical protein TTHERM_000895865 (macronuclear) [Tetrahymena thermophila SB210]|uniref:Uncharacterized protein n=1 Tax=Tetrahymena thermophila (strain SB210) TaxID=312017 RepID=W7XKX8_TETTS|nr:hypothetical protein TTHERM_000895865 [Tetrahymena thermophila SB210]EWS75314.1 hypothetical protein TTHERM_000895865 [Tetrahymena thermophila SB210]|eukprot:XP_012652146.1 hypothetical protein TTHERM_000895865 [Tetrahymena thermophila SB210]